jgi:hypothetical protein
VVVIVGVTRVPVSVVRDGIAGIWSLVHPVSVRLWTA